MSVDVHSMIRNFETIDPRTDPGNPEGLPDATELGIIGYQGCD